MGRENSGAIQLYYYDHGHGAPVVLVHGYHAALVDALDVREVVLIGFCAGTGEVTTGNRCPA